MSAESKLWAHNTRLWAHFNIPHKLWTSETKSPNQGQLGEHFSLLSLRRSERKFEHFFDSSQISSAFQMFDCVSNEICKGKWGEWLEARAKEELRWNRRGGIHTQLGSITDLSKCSRLQICHLLDFFRHRYTPKTFVEARILFPLKSKGQIFFCSDF